MLFLFVLFLPFLAHATVLDYEVARDLDRLSIDVGSAMAEPDTLLDVAIIGGGQGGLSLALALQKREICNIQIFDRAEEGLEGPWSTVARMRTLRSGKDFPGPALDFSILTFQSWYEATHTDWNDFSKAKTSDWAAYLRWFREVLQLPVLNGWKLLKILPEDKGLKLLFDQEREVLCRKVVLATGRDGFGGFEIPEFVKNLPKSIWFHTGEDIDFSLFQGKRVCVLGSSASAFDIAATAAESGAIQVEMLIRRKELPQKTPFTGYVYWGSFYHLSDLKRVQFFEQAWKVGNPPPPESIHRLSHLPACRCLYDTWIESAAFDNELVIQTNRGLVPFDLLILATGYAIDIQNVPELSELAPHILLWGDKHEAIPPKLSRFPYLGSHFQFLEKTPGAAPFLKNIYCFNYGSFLSHGRIAGDVDQLPIGIERLADGIAIDMCLETY